MNIFKSCNFLGVHEFPGFIALSWMEILWCRVKEGAWHRELKQSKE